jgi:hypothetical protein
MSTLVLDRQGSLDEIFAYESTRQVAGVGGECGVADGSYANRTGAHGWLTLDALITGVWEGLAVRDAVRCPACGGAMAPCSADEAGVYEVDCLDCGAHLS